MKLQDSVIKTLKYSDHFDYPLTRSEIHSRLISNTPRSVEQITETIDLLIKQKQIATTGDYFYLPGRKSLVDQRLRRESVSRTMLRRAQLLSSRLSRIPFVKAIYLTGSLAMHNSTTHSDIDLFIITQEGRLWTTRLVLTIYTTLLGLRRYPGSLKTQDKLCLNLYLTPASYLLPQSKQNLYTAYELVQAVPVYDPTDTRASLLATNSWIQKYLPNILSSIPSRPGLEGRLSTRSDLLRKRPKGVFSRLQNTIRRPGQTLLDILEKILFKLQYLYMRPKLTREHITIDSAFFHPHDPSPRV